MRAAISLHFRMKDLESKLAERDAMIRVLQKHTYEKDVSASSYQSMLGRSPHHTPHPSLHGNSDLGTVLGASVSREELGKKLSIISCHKRKLCVSVPMLKGYIKVQVLRTLYVHGIAVGSNGHGSTKTHACID
jgi:hypothetical protein